MAQHYECKAYVNSVWDALIHVDIRNAEFYRASAETYISEFDQLNRHLRALTATLDMSQSEVITDHDAFRYLEWGYGLQFSALQGNSVFQLSPSHLRSRLRLLFAKPVKSLQVLFLRILLSID